MAKTKEANLRHNKKGSLKTGKILANVLFLLGLAAVLVFLFQAVGF